MAAKKKNKKGQDGKSYYSDYPIKTLFQISVLAATVTFVVTYLNNSSDLVSVLFKTFIVFIFCAVVGGGIMIVAVSLMAKLQEEKAQDMKRRIEKEQKEFFESQLKLHEELDKINKGESETTQSNSG